MVGSTINIMLAVGSGKNNWQRNSAVGRRIGRALARAERVEQTAESGKPPPGRRRKKASGGRNSTRTGARQISDAEARGVLGSIVVSARLEGSPVAQERAESVYF
jgi:hypothetical protein